MLAIKKSINESYPNKYLNTRQLGKQTGIRYPTMPSRKQLIYTHQRQGITSNA